MGTNLDQNAQPGKGLNADTNLKKHLEHLLGLCRGLLADNELSEGEIIFLDTWMKEHQELNDTWAGRVIAQRLAEILADNIVTPEESADLKQTIEQIIGGGLEDGITGGNATSLPVDQGAKITIEGALFCFTGAFVLGTRKACERLVIERGGAAASNVSSKTAYLVIGGLASRDWKHTSHGTKIEKAMALKDKGHHITIIDEPALTAIVSD